MNANAFMNWCTHTLLGLLILCYFGAFLATALRLIFLIVENWETRKTMIIVTPIDVVTALLLAQWIGQVCGSWIPVPGQ